MKILAIGKLTPDSLAFICAAQDAMNLVSYTSTLHSGEPSITSGGSPQGARK